MKPMNEYQRYWKCALTLSILICSALSVQSKVTGDTSVKLAGFSYLNALDDNACRSLNAPRCTGSVDPETITDLGASAVTMGQLGPCHDPLYVYPVLSEGDQYIAEHRLNFYPSIVLRSGNNILKDGDTVCVGDVITVEPNITGDYFNDGGGNDCPPISFVSAEKMEQTLNNYLLSHKNEVLSEDTMDYPSEADILDLVAALTPSMQGSITDPLSGLPAYSETGVRECVPAIYASVMCTSNMQTGSDAKTITPRNTGQLDITASYSPQCVLLNPNSYSMLGGYYGSPGIGEKTHNRVFIKPAGWTYKKGDLNALPSYKDTQTPWLKYLDKNAYMTVSASLKVIEVTEKPKLHLKASSLGGIDGKYVIRAVLNNTGNAKALIDKVSLNLGSYTILYKPASLEQGAESDILAETDMNSITSLTSPLTLTVEYRSEKLGCLTDRQMKDSYVLNLVSVITPKRSAQVYAMEVAGACRNTYYSCSEGTDSTSYNLGYRCYNKDPYYDPSVARAVLEYELPKPSAGMNVSNAIMSFAVQEVYGSQDLEVYDTKGLVNMTTCVAGGDICTQPYCPECAPMNFAGTRVVSSVKVTAPGKYSMDITSAVVSNLQGRTITLQARTGKEDRWKEEGINSCKEANTWNNHGLKIGDSPAIVLFYE